MDISKRTKSETELIQKFTQSPETAMAELTERYTGLVQSTVERYLASPEDVEECVNDTFMEFFRTRERFDSEKGSLGTYLAGIAKNLAISRFRRNAARPTVELPENIANANDPIGDAELQMDLEQAISQLPPAEADLIRMKYYDGMTIQEIAEAQEQPYETVKKRHQRSLGKLRTLLIVGLGILLAAILAACAYFVLRGFGLLPGYGMNSTPDIPVYLLAEEASTEGERWTYTVKEAIFLNGKLRIDVTVQFPDEDVKEQWRNMFRNITNKRDPLATLSDGSQTSTDSVIQGNKAYIQTIERDFQVDKNKVRLIMKFENIEQMLDGKQEVELTLNVCEAELPITLSSAALESPGTHSYALAEQGGVLAVPKREDGVLAMELYPLNTGGYEVTPDLIWGPYRQGKTGDITVTGEDGRALVGEMTYTPFSDQLSVWEFGPAEPGEYVLHIPYLYLMFNFDGENTHKIDLNLETCQWGDQAVELPFGTVRIVSCQKMDGELRPGDAGWRIVVQFDTEAELNATQVQFRINRWPAEKSFTALPDHCVEYQVYVPENTVDPTQPLDFTQSELCLMGTVGLLWEHEFEIPFTVE